MRLHQGFVRRRARIEIIPLIDIIFFLLATFVMVSLSMIKNQGISVRLPKAVTATTADQKASTVISIKENGDLYLNKEQVSSDQLMQRLTDLKNADPDQKIFIHGDELAYFGDIVAVMDHIRKAGIEKIGIQTQNIKPPSGSASK